MQKYLRLFNYDNACKVIDFINNNDKEDYANITSGGVSMQVKQENWNDVLNFIESFKVRYEINDEHPEKTVKNIVTNLRKANIIK